MKKKKQLEAWRDGAADIETTSPSYSVRTLLGERKEFNEMLARRLIQLITEHSKSVSF